jgi:preprotein translocase subunit SecD
MMIRHTRFNLNLALVTMLVLTLCPACKTHTKDPEKDLLATLQLRQELNRDPRGATEEVPIYRDNPVMLTVSKQPFLTERNVKEAKVVEVTGGFALQLQFDRKGSWLLEQYTMTSRGRRIAIFCQFEIPPEKVLNKGRWLAAPKIVNHITTGLLVFTPDATREESEHIARELNNVHEKIQSQDYFKEE